MMLTNPEPERPTGRHPDDFYATPAWATEAMLRSRAVPLAPDYILEPSCGDGAILDCLARWSEGREWGAVPGVSGIEMDSSRAAECERRGHSVTVGDFFDWRPSPLWPSPWVVGNPPFRHAREFVEHALSSMGAGGRCTMLLRLAFLASAARAHLYAPGAGFYHLGVLGKRPSFTPGGGTDSSDYGWFTWEVGYTGPATVERL